MSKVKASCTLNRIVHEEETRILHVTESHAKADGGVTTVVNDLSLNIGLLGAYSCVQAATDIDEPTPAGVDLVKMGASCNSMSSLFSSELKESIRAVVLDKQINVIHIHGVWQPLQIVASRLAKEMGIPFVITLHGMLEPWLWTGKGLKGLVKKKACFRLMAYPIYKYASRVHAITPQEHKNLKLLFPGNQHVIVPNAIELIQNKKVTELVHDKVIFFIGRITPVKGIDLLLKAFLAAQLSSVWQLVIAGPEEVPEYAAELREFVKVNGLSSQVKFIGPVYAEEKDDWYRRSWITVVPSYSEVIGMINLEAAALHCPTITTTTTGLADWEEGGGVLIKPDVSELTAALKLVTAWGDEERRSRGIASYALVKNKYAWNVVGKQWMELYSSLVSEGKV